MALSGKGVVVAVLVIVAIGGVFGEYYVSTSATISAQSRSMSAFESTISSLVSHVSTSTYLSTSKSTTTTTVYSVEHDYGLSLPWASAMFMASPSKYCAALCFGADLGGAIVFPCTNTTASVGCSVTVYDSSVGANYSFVVNYPVYNQTNEFPVDNCEFNVSVGIISYTPVPGGQGFGYCAWIGPDDFVVAQQQPPPA